MTQQEKAMAYLDQYQGEMMTLWENLVRLESPSSDPSAVDKLASHLDTYCRALGMETEKFRPEGAGTCLSAWTAERELSPVLLLGHMNTVHPAGSFPGGRRRSSPSRAPWPGTPPPPAPGRPAGWCWG